MGPFIALHCKNFVRRIALNYFIRDFQIASLELLLGLITLLFGVIFGAGSWLHSEMTGTPATAGTVMLSGLPILLGVQLLIAFINFDIRNQPTTPASQSIRFYRGASNPSDS
jgi:predicted RND superfamily exporter protein